MADDELLRSLASLVAASRRCEADLVAHIGEVDVRRLYVQQATPSMFVYCTERLPLSEADACLRIAAARASRAHPVILEMLADGRLHLSAIAKLAPRLTAESGLELLRRATHRSKREVDELVAEIAPRPDVPTVIRKLPAGRFVARPVAERLAILAATGLPDAGVRPEGVDSDHLDAVGGCGSHVTVGAECEGRSALGATCGLDFSRGSAAPLADRGPCSETEADSGTDASSDRSARSAAALRSQRDARSDTGPAWVAARPRPAAIEPLAPSRYKVVFTASARLREKLERLQALMRSSVPDGDLAAVIEAAVTEKLERLEARRFGKTKAPRKSVAASDTTPRARSIPAAVRRVVSERDQGQCAYVDADGHRCTARAWIQLHHRHPRAFGGDHTPDNVAIVCAAHNRLMAEIDYGRSAVGKHRRTIAGAPKAQLKSKTG